MPKSNITAWLIIISVQLSCAVSIYSGEKIESVSTLVEKLVSPVEPPNSNGYLPKLTTISDGISTGFMHEDVRIAKFTLVEKGPLVFPELAGHIDDERYSYSHVSAAWRNYSVGDMVRRIFAEGIEFYGWGYRFRENSKGSNAMPRFDEYLDEIGVEKWAADASKRTRNELRRKFIEWYVAKEIEYGFVDQEQREKFIGPCLVELDLLANDESVPISVIVSTTGGTSIQGSWYLSINSAGEAALTIYSSPKNQMRKFQVDGEFLARVSEEVDRQQFFDLDSSYGEIVPSGGWTSLTIVRGVDAKRVSFHFFGNWIHSAPEKLKEPSRGLRVLKVVQECFENKEAVNLQRYYDFVISSANGD